MSYGMFYLGHCVYEHILNLMVKFGDDSHCRGSSAAYLDELSELESIFSDLKDRFEEANIKNDNLIPNFKKMCPSWFSKLKKSKLIN